LRINSSQLSKVAKGHPDIAPIEVSGKEEAPDKSKEALDNSEKAPDESRRDERK
jgi:hypothetical protein